MNRTKTTTRGTKNNRIRPVALLTDFGITDHYVGTMKGVILSINPEAMIVDISHEVAPHDVLQAGYLLWASYRYFPPNTIFVAVVDPGVGGSRKIICVETGNWIFIAPDNGLLDVIVSQEHVRQAYEVLYSEHLISTSISSTFHGRDIFGPLAANLSLGKSIRRFGKPFNVSTPRSPFYEPEAGIKVVRILHIDRFGNLITNIPERYFEDCIIGVGRTKISKHIRTYTEAPPKEACLIVGSNGLIEVVAKEASAAEMLRAGLDTQVTILSSPMSR